MIRQQNDNGVSPVIGVILMVAITVIIAAVVANFVLNLGQSLEEEPTATVTFNQEVEDFANQRYNISVSVTNMGNTDYLVIGTAGQAGYEFPTITDGSSGDVSFGDYNAMPPQSIITYSGVNPFNVTEAPNTAGDAESVPSNSAGAVLVSAGDQVVVTGLNATEQVQVFGGISGREAQVDSVTVEETLG